MISRSAVGLRVAARDDRAVGGDDLAAPGRRRLGGGRSDDPQELLRVVRRGERLAEVRQRFAYPGALGLELGEPRLELLGHVVERGAQRSELVVPADGDALTEAPERDPASSGGDPAEVPGDRPSLEICDDAHEPQAGEQPEQEPVPRARVSRVDDPLRRQDSQSPLGQSRQPGSGERAITDARKAHRRALRGVHRDIPLQTRRRRDDPRSLQYDESVGRVEGGIPSETAHEAETEREGSDDLAEPARAARDVDGQPSGETQWPADTQAVGADDVERRSARENQPQRAAVSALERQLQRPRPRRLPGLRLRPILPLLIERERGA
jgi:hypothetical protein